MQPNWSRTPGNLDSRKERGKAESIIKMRLLKFLACTDKITCYVRASMSGGGK
jgi:hypothetical protein